MLAVSGGGNVLGDDDPLTAEARKGGGGMAEQLVEDAAASVVVEIGENGPEDTRPSAQRRQRSGWATDVSKTAIL